MAAASTTQALPYILVTYKGASIAVPRAECSQYGSYTVGTIRGSIGLMCSIRTAHPSLRDVEDSALIIEARLPGAPSAVQFVRSLWDQISRNVEEVVVRLPPTEAEKRRKLITEVSTSQITVKTPEGQFLRFSINLKCADAYDLKTMIEEKTGVPVESQILLLTRTIYVSNRKLYNNGDEVPADDVLVQYGIVADETLQMRIAPRSQQVTTLDVVVRSGR